MKPQVNSPVRKLIEGRLLTRCLLAALVVTSALVGVSLDPARVAADGNCFGSEFTETNGGVTAAKESFATSCGWDRWEDRPTQRCDWVSVGWQCSGEPGSPQATAETSTPGPVSTPGLAQREPITLDAERNSDQTNASAGRIQNEETCHGKEFGDSDGGVAVAKNSFAAECGWSSWEDRPDRRCDWITFGWRCSGPRGTATSTVGDVVGAVHDEHDYASAPGSTHVPTPSPTTDTYLDVPVLSLDDTNRLRWLADDAAESYEVYQNGELLDSYQNTRRSGEEIGYRIPIGVPAVYWIVANHVDGQHQSHSNNEVAFDSTIEQEGDYYSVGTSQFPWGRSAHTGPRRDLLVGRLKFNQDQNQSHLSTFTPRRNSLNSVERQRFDEAVADIRQSLAHRGKDLTAPDRTMDPSMSYLLAAGLVESFWPRTELAVLSVTEVGGRWFVHDNHSGHARCDPSNELDQLGDFLGGRDPRVRIDVQHVIDLALNGLDGVTIRASDLTAVHEAAHILDCKRRPLGMTGSQETELRSIQDAMFDEYRATGDLNGLTDYAFTNGNEWFAEAVERFINDLHRDTLMQDNPRLYTVLRDYLQRQSDTPSVVTIIVRPIEQAE